IAPYYGYESAWQSLATNKYGAAVAGALVQNGKLRVLILPRVRHQVGLLRELLGGVLPEMAPHLFSEHVGAKWVEDAPYELPTIVSLKTQIIEVEATAEKQIEMMRRAIETERAAMGFLHDLLRETGDGLVAAVKTAVKVLGFKSVIDSDEHRQPGDRRR